MTDLVCGGCTLCCQRQVVPMIKGIDRTSSYECTRREGQWVLRWKTNGDCIYLDREKGCTIWPRRPAVCRGFDCRQVTDGRPDIVARGQELSK